jgi:anti-anti-sigma factor
MQPPSVPFVKAPMMKLLEHRSDGVVVLHVNGRIDSATSREFGQRLAAVFEAGSTSAVVDLRDTSYVSSSGFRALLIAAQQAGRHSGKLVLSNLSPELRKLFELSSLLDLFVVCPSWEEGVTACQT